MSKVKTVAAKLPPSVTARFEGARTPATQPAHDVIAEADATPSTTPPSHL